MGGFMLKREELTGIPRAVFDGVAKLRAVVEIFPPPGIGLFSAGIGIGCGVGWPIRQAYGPPRAFCGAGVGVGVVAAGYGQGFIGVRYGRDRRAPETKENIAALEKWIVDSCDRLSDGAKRTLRSITGKEEKLSRDATPRKWWQRLGRQKENASAFVRPLRSGHFLLGCREGSVHRHMASTVTRRR